MSSQTFSTFSEVGMIDARSQNGSITLPLTTDIPYRILTLKDIYGAASLSSITLVTQGTDVFEDGGTSRLINGAFETTTLYAGQAGYWYVIGGSRLTTAAIGTLSTGIIANPLRLGTLSTQTAIQFPGLRSNYTGTVIAGQGTGIGTQELLLYQASSISDQIRLQTTGNIVFEAGASARLWPSTQTLTTPTLYIQGSTSNIGVGTAAPATTLDVAGTGRFQIVSSLSLIVSTVNGIVPGAAFNGSTIYLSASLVQTQGLSTFNLAAAFASFSSISTNTVQSQLVSTQAINTSSINGSAPWQQTYTTSTVLGLGTIGYVSTLLNVPLVSTQNIQVCTINGLTFGGPINSTVIGLGTAGYISSSQLYSTVTGIGQGFTGSTLGLSAATIGVSTINMMYLSSVQGYVSSLRTDNLIVGGPTGYVTIQDLTTGTVSTGQVVAGAGFISSLQINSLSFGPSGYVIVSNILAASLSTQKLNAQNIYANNVYVGNTSTQSAILFPGIDGTYRGTAVAEQTTGIGTQELLLYKVSTTSDQIRLQTTGNIVFEAGAAARSWNSTTQLATPTLYIQGSSSNVGVGTATPVTTLDVAGTGRFQILSSYTLNVSSINGILPGAAFNGSTIGLSSATIFTSSIVTTSLTASTALITYNGTAGGSYGQGLDTLTLQSSSNAYVGGIASMAFATSKVGYPLARIYALDSATSGNAISQLVFQTVPQSTSTSFSNAFYSVGSNQTFTVPVNVSQITVTMWGAGGGGSCFDNFNPGGPGAYITGTLAVTSGQSLTIVVGSGGIYLNNVGASSSYGGGGGVPTNGQKSQGGGRSAIQLNVTAVISSGVVSGGNIVFTTNIAHTLVLNQPIVISGLNTGFNGNFLVTATGSSTQFTVVNLYSATGSSVGSGSILAELVNVGGGGGGGFNRAGGAAAYTGTASAGSNYTTSSTGGGGGTQSAGGAAGVGDNGYGTATAGSVLQGGQGATYGGGGGGGYFGGGGGSASNSGGAAGGGGSSYISNSLFSLITGSNGSGTTAPATTVTGYVSNAAAGGAQTANGGPGLILFSYQVVTGVTLTEAMRINSNAYVGIGTTTPATSLDVAGTARAQTVSTLNINLSTINGSTVTQLVVDPIQSTVTGLGTAGYVSAPQLAATSNYFRNLLALNVSSGISTAALYTSNTSNYFLPALSNNLSSAASSLGLYTSNTSNYFQNLLALNVSSGISTAALYTSNTSNYFLPLLSNNYSTNLASTLDGLGTAGYISTAAFLSSTRGRTLQIGTSSISSAFITATQGYISSLIVDSLAIGSNSGFINMGDIITTSLSSLQINTGILTASGAVSAPQLIVSSINGQQPIILPNLTSTTQGLGLVGYISSLANVSSISTLNINVCTINGQTFGAPIQSTVIGLGTAGYISSSQFLSSMLGMTSNISSMIDPVELASSIVALGTVGFVSSIGLTTILNSTVSGVNIYISQQVNSSQLISSIVGLGTQGYTSSFINVSNISTLNINLCTINGQTFGAPIQSTVIGLGNVGYVSTLSNVANLSTLNINASTINGQTFGAPIQSTVIGLGLAGYASTSYVKQQISSLSTAIGQVGATFTGSTIYLSAAIIQTSTISTVQLYAQNVTTQALSTNALIFGVGTGTLLMPDIAPNTLYTSTVTTSNLQVGWTSNQSPIQFYGYGTYSNTVIVEQSTGTTTQELFVFRGSNAADRIRFQTTGYMAIETGVSSRLYTNAVSNVTPAVMIDINSNVGIQLAAPAFPLDVGGTIRAPILSTLTLQTSTIGGAIFTRSLYVNSTTFLLDEVSTSFLLGNFNTLTFKTAGAQRATFTQAGNLGVGITNPQFLVDIAGITRLSTIYNSTSISYNFISAPLLVTSTVNTANAQITNTSTGQINTSTIYGRWNDAQYYVLQTL